jgi:hypothetical protein
MNIPSTRTRHDMEIAADLRAQGGTWVTGFMESRSSSRS